MHYFNTNGVTNERIAQVTAKALSQTEGVLTLFQRKPNAKVPASTVLAAGIRDGFFNEKTPITSIRRSMSVLVKEGKLLKLDEVKEGPMGASEHLFMLKPIES